jgi:plastocyanin
MTLLVLLLTVGLVAGACSKKAATPGSIGTPRQASPTETESGGGTITIGGDTANDHGTKDVSGLASLELELDNFYFNPTVIKGTAGAKLKLELKNDSSALHNFTLTPEGIDNDVQPGTTVEVTVTIPESGFLEFFCKYHKASGMVGELAGA